MAPARFGASKFRNATSSATPTETWYRTSLPATSSAQFTSSSSLSTFSSEIKTNRRWIVTVTPSGDVSWRSYSEGPVGTMKVGPVGDWDLSRLEDECLAIGGTDGNVGPDAKVNEVEVADQAAQDLHATFRSRRGSQRGTGHLGRLANHHRQPTSFNTLSGPSRCYSIPTIRL